jgi:predicted nucleic acid-binding protein
MSGADDATFIDSNILVYTDDRRDPRKQEIALARVEQLRRRQTGFVSTQVLEEYFVAATRKLGVAADVARAKVELFGELHLIEIGLSDILAAIDLHRLHHLSMWDALLVACARRAGCVTLLSEDLQHERRIDGVRIENPFVDGR